MTYESSKTRAVRGSGFEAHYLQGRVIDIGCGPDPVVPHAEPFDLADGDAQEIATLRPLESYDAVVSSHCLEHMRDVPRALAQWWSLLKENGYLILVVPDEDLYEQGTWPSLFNRDHKATFRMNKSTSWSPVSYDIVELVSRLPQAKIVTAERQDQHYDYALLRSSVSPLQRAVFVAWRLCGRVLRMLRLVDSTVERGAAHLFAFLGAPVDQTQGLALAQIQIIARKEPKSRQ